MYTISKEFHFDAAHKLPDYDGPCGNLHGHTWTVTIKISTDTLKDNFIIDFKQLSKIVDDWILTHVDHQYLNEIYPKLYPSCENLAHYFCRVLVTPLGAELKRPYILEINLQEGKGGSASYELLV